MAGSMPGTLSMELQPGGYFFEPCMIFLGVDPGPTPIAIFDPVDQRYLQVGVSAVETFFGFFPANGVYQVGPMTVPNLSTLIDLPFFFQGLTIGGATTIVDRISNPAAVRMAPAGAFRDRGVAMFYDRIFGTVILRADRRWMVCGGASGALLAQFARDSTEIYDDVTDLFWFGPLMTSPRSLHTMTELDDGRTLLVGGVDLTNVPRASCEVYDPVADMFVAVAQMNVPRMGHTAVKLDDGRVFVSGGFDALTIMPTQLTAIFDIVESSEIYDPVANTWTLGPNMSTPRAGHVAIKRPNGEVLLAGGISWDNLIFLSLPAARSSCDIYNPTSGSMSSGPSMSVPHALLDPVDMGNDRWLVAGGLTSMSILTPGVSTNVAEIYDAVTNSWSAAGSMATVRSNHKTFPLGGGKFLAVGGGNGTINAVVPLASGEIYDLNTNSWSPGPSLTVPRGAMAMFMTPRGQIHIMGGSSTNGNTLISTEWYFF